MCGRYYGLADLDAYRLFVSRDDGHLIGPAKPFTRRMTQRPLGTRRQRLAFFVPTPARSSVVPIRGCNMAADSTASQNSLPPQTLARRMENENDVAI